MKLRFAGVLLMLAALTGCVSNGTPEPTPSTDAAAPSASPSTVMPSAAPSDLVTWVPSGAPADPAAYAHPDGGVAFASPSGNIQCGFSEYGSNTPWWWCLLQSQTVVLPPDPRGACSGTDASGAPIAPNGLGVDASDPAALPVSFCAGAADSEVLSYGTSLTYRDMACDSTEDGMICRSLVSGHGFRLSRSDYELY